MSGLASCLYRGVVSHRRVAPVTHELRYRVYNMFVDVDELPALAKRLRCFSYNGFNLFSIADRNHGPGDGTPVTEAIWRIAKATPTTSPVTRIFMFCYPSVFGVVFNPLTVYYGFASDDALVLTVYEVNNTFGERHTYAVPVADNVLPSTPKQLHVSPFNRVEGEYRFRAGPPGDQLRLGIALETGGSPCLKAWFEGTRTPLTDGNLLRSFLSLPLLPIQVMGGIHWEALKLWRKGLPFRRKPSPPSTPLTIVSKRSGT
jgi:uncharacterized protein